MVFIIVLICLLIKYCWLEDGEEEIDSQEIEENGRLHCDQTSKLPGPCPACDHFVRWPCSAISSTVAVDSLDYNTILA